MERCRKRWRGHSDDRRGRQACVGSRRAAAAGRAHLVVLSSSPAMQTAGTTTVVMVLGSDEARVRAAGDALKARLGVKGGGKGTRWSGKFTGVWREAKEGAVVDEILGI